MARNGDRFRSARPVDGRAGMAGHSAELEATSRTGIGAVDRLGMAIDQRLHPGLPSPESTERMHDLSSGAVRRRGSQVSGGSLKHRFMERHQ